MTELSLHKGHTMSIIDVVNNMEKGWNAVHHCQTLVNTKTHNDAAALFWPWEPNNMDDLFCYHHVVGVFQ